MNVRSAVFSLVSLKSRSIADIRDRLPYGSKAVYANVEKLLGEGLLVKVRGANGIVVAVADGFQAQKLREIHVQCLSHGLDPEFLLRDSTLRIWCLLDAPRIVAELEKETRLSSKWIMNVLNTLEKNGLVVFQKRKPVIAVRAEEHVLNGLLSAYLNSHVEGDGVYHPGTRPFEEKLKTPEEIERSLYAHDGKTSLAVTNTGFMLRGAPGARLTVLERVDKELEPEEVFLMKLFTTDGAEDTCVHMVAQKLLDYDRLFELAKKSDIVNIVGCYLDVLQSIGIKVPMRVIMLLRGNVSKRRRIFLVQERKYGKNGWERQYEEKWNVDLYLDIDALRHGARAA